VRVLITKAKAKVGKGPLKGFEYGTY